MDIETWDRAVILRATALVVCSTVVLTAAFIGVLAMVRGAVVDPGSRLPVYVLLTAIVFVTALFTLESPDDPGTPIIATTLGVGVAAFVLVSLGGEGVVYAVDNPGEVLTTQIVFYVVAAALICTAVAYWSLNHWREFVA